MKNPPKVIVRMVASSSGKTIAYAMESILSQTYDNLELHVTIRGSTDNTAEIANKYADKDPRVRVIVNEQAFIYDKGNDIKDYYREYDVENDYVCFIDGDDEYKPEFLEKMVAFAGENNLDIACCGSDCIDSGTRELIDVRKPERMLIVESDAFGTLFREYFEYVRTRWGKVCRLKILDKVVYDECYDMLPHGDTIEMLEYFCYAGRIGLLPESYYVYYWHKRSLSRKWYNIHPKANQILHDRLVRYLSRKAGSVSAGNYKYLRENYFGELYHAVKILFYVKETPGKTLEALYDLLINPYTYELVVSGPGSNEDSRRRKMPKQVIEYLESNKDRFTGEHEIKKYDELLLAMQMSVDAGLSVEAVVCNVIHNERPRSVLEISGFDLKYGKLIREFPNYGLADSYDCRDIKVDRIDLTDGGALESEGSYNDVYNSGALSDISRLKRYDVIIVLHLFENMPPPDAKAMLEALLAGAGKQVLVITPEYPYDLESEEENRKSDVRAYHPVFFLGMDFSYIMIDTPEGQMQAYSFFPRTDYKLLPCDRPADSKPAPGSKAPPDGNRRKLNIAYVIVHHELTGAMKALFRNMKEMAAGGHSISAYYRSNSAKKAIPGWSPLIDEDVKTQVVIPESASYLDYIKDADIIILSWLLMAPEFAGSKIPVALWEQGTPAFYGDHKELIASGSNTRQTLHELYRQPVHLLAVSFTIQAALKGIYNREAQYFPAGIDIDFYYPNPDKNNEVPVVLLVGNPWLEFKGFGFALAVLEVASAKSMFEVKLVMQMEKYEFPDTSYKIEKYVDPPQEELAELYRNADILISPSLYESFPLPPIEAMASGVAVIATDCGGINTYAEPGVNCLLCEQGDLESMVYALDCLLADADMRAKLAAAGRETALRFSMSSIMPQLEECLYRIVDKPL